MARQRNISPERKAFIKGMLDHYHPETARDVQEKVLFIQKQRSSAVSYIRYVIPQSSSLIKISDLSWWI